MSETREQNDVTVARDALEYLDNFGADVRAHVLRIAGIRGERVTRRMVRESLHLGCYKALKHRLPESMAESEVSSLRSQLAEAERKNGELEQRAESAEQERDRMVTECLEQIKLAEPPPGKSWNQMEGGDFDAGASNTASRILEAASTPAAPEAESQPDEPHRKPITSLSRIAVLADNISESILALDIPNCDKDALTEECAKIIREAIGLSTPPPASIDNQEPAQVVKKPEPGCQTPFDRDPTQGLDIEYLRKWYVHFWDQAVLVRDAIAACEHTNPIPLTTGHNELNLVRGLIEKIEALHAENTELKSERNKLVYDNAELQQKLDEAQAELAQPCDCGKLTAENTRLAAQVEELKGELEQIRIDRVSRSGEFQYAAIHRDRSGQDAGSINYAARVGSIDALTDPEKRSIIRCAEQLLDSIRRCIPQSAAPSPSAAESERDWGQLPKEIAAALVDLSYVQFNDREKARIAIAQVIGTVAAPQPAAAGEQKTFESAGKTWRYTGEMRLPKQGENFFHHATGDVWQASADYENNPYRIVEEVKPASPSQSAAAVEAGGDNPDYDPAWDEFCTELHKHLPPEMNRSVRRLVVRRLYDIAAGTTQPAAPPPAAPAETGEKWVAALVNRTTSHEEWVVRMKIGFATKEQAEAAAAKVNAKPVGWSREIGDFYREPGGESLEWFPAERTAEWHLITQDGATKEQALAASRAIKECADLRSQLSQLQAEAQQREEWRRTLERMAAHHIKLYACRKTHSGDKQFWAASARLPGEGTDSTWSFFESPHRAIEAAASNFPALASQLESSGGAE